MIIQEKIEIQNYIIGKKKKDSPFEIGDKTQRKRYEKVEQEINMRSGMIRVEK
jgi:hypothetical protein